MEQMNIEHINPFLIATKSVLRDMCGIELTAGAPYVKKEKFDENTVVICLGVTGQIKGQVLLSCSYNAACDIASKMCMMPITVLDELPLSALCELGNMVFGNAATVLSTKDVIIDITPPTIIQGNFSIANNFAQNICIPFKYDTDKTIEVDVSVKEA
ncbi:MAG: chemotaxis protein CheX [Butyrivibrio sp.]